MMLPLAIEVIAGVSTAEAGALTNANADTASAKPNADIVALKIFFPSE